MKFNPNHQVMQTTDGQWHKIVAILLHKFKLGTVVITEEDIQSLTDDYAGQQPVVLLYGSGDRLELSIVDESRAQAIAKAAGGKAN